MLAMIQEDTEVGLKTLSRCIEHGGNVRALHRFKPTRATGHRHRYWTATALHVAASTNCLAYAEFLIDHGAKTTDVAHGFLDHPIFNGYMWLKNFGAGLDVLEFELMDKINRTQDYVLPLCAPYLRHDKDMIRLLLAKSAPVTLQRSKIGAHELTILHLEAARQPADFQSDLFRRCAPHLKPALPGCVNLPPSALPDRQMNPIPVWEVYNLAVRGANVEMVEVLLELGASPDGCTTSQRDMSPLCAALEGFAITCQSKMLQPRYKAIVEMLLDQGADANYTNNLVTPFACLLRCIRIRKRLPSKFIVEMIDVLLDKGMDINALSQEDVYVLGAPLPAWYELVLIIIIMNDLQKDQKQILYQIFHYLLDKGADMSLDIGYQNHSMLFHFLLGRRTLAKSLLKAGYTLEARDMDDFFPRWIQDGKLQNAYPNILQHRQHIRQDTINACFEEALEVAADGKAGMLEQLAKDFTYVRDSKTDDMVKDRISRRDENGLVKPNRKVMEFIFTLDLNPTRAHRKDGGWVYCIVEHFTAVKAYSDEDATSDAQRFIKKGASASLVNKKSKLDPLQLLEQWLDTRRGTQGHKLLRLLYRTQIAHLKAERR
ncbi:hypothetical protein N3K66_002989 [Trichothecium roseum]|uniref:Uncharacterized protein n=1 Tax=Trichothecium roseum TaxID=47278 RepID=A0ACC0V5Y0_9HYPO|nr:hypothetical protein N3K66_002989 [Trichothecium roseum]